MLFVLQKQQNNLIAGLRATNELLTLQDHTEDKHKESSLDRESEEPKRFLTSEVSVSMTFCFSYILKIADNSYQKKK